MSNIDIFSVITIAFLGSFGHCIGMCGGIVIAYSSAKTGPDWGTGRRAIAHLLYSLGRTVTYGALGVAFGYLGGVTTFSNKANGAMLVLAGAAMILAGLSLAGKVSFLNSLNYPVSSHPWFQRIFRYLLQDQSLFSLYFLGMLNGLLPCGFVYFFAITAASTASPIWGAVVMMIFGLSTLPALFSLGFFVGLIQQGRWRGIIMTVAAVAVVVYGIFTMYSGYEYIVDPEKFILDCHGD